jgi:glycosyltransferase involved in cell wall biosynthesis
MDMASQAKAGLKSSSDVLRVVAFLNTPAPYRAFEFDRLSRELAGVMQFHLLLMERSFADMSWTDDLPKVATWEVMPLLEWKMLRRIPGLRRVNLGVVRFLERARPDAVLLHGYDAPSLWTALRWARRNHRGVLYRCDSNGPEERSRKGLWRTTIKAPVLRWFFRKIDAFLPIGSANEDYLRLYGARDSTFFRTGIQVDTEFYRKTAEEERARGMPLRAALGITQRRVVLYVGRFVPQKGILDLLAAYQRILTEFGDVGLLLVGDGPLRGEIEARCAGIRSSVHLPGFLQPADVARVYGIADVFVLPSRHEPWGLVVNEALAAGLPVIASNRVGAAADLVVPGVSGEQFPAENVDVLTECLRKVLTGDRATAYSAGALRTIADWTTRFDVVRAYRDAVTFAIARARPRATR